MFSVKDLLISHGYKQSKSPTNSSDNPGNGDQHEDTGRQSGQAPRNGLPSHPGAIPKTNKARGYQNDDKSNLVVRGRTRNTIYENFPGPGNAQGGLYDQSQLSRSSHSKNIDYRRRQCQDFGALDYPDRADYETRGTAAAENQSQWEAEERLETMTSNKRETVKPAGDNRRQREPDTDNKERPLQDVYSGRQNIAASHKSQSLPRFLSPDYSNYAEIPAVASGKQHKVKPELESLKHSDPATRPKYGRPLKPPSYEFHQQSRGVVETNLPQDEQQQRKTIFYVTKVDETNQDATLEPPLYIPPPSYKSPGQQNNNQHVPKEVADYDECFIKEMQVVGQNICIRSESSFNQLQMEGEEPILYGKKQLSCQDKHKSSIQYIPFDDPRIRHIKVIHPADYQLEDQTEDANKTLVFYRNAVDQEFNNSDADVPYPKNIIVKGSQVPGSSRWLGEYNIDQDSCALSTQRGSYDAGNDLNFEYPKSWPSAQSPGATEYSSEIFTKVKTFEPGTEIQGRNHLKKKTNETMFCLVSVPLQHEQKMPNCNRNKSAAQGVNEKDETHSYRDLKEQSFLSTSSSDLELQALTGNMINKSLSERQDFHICKKMHDLSCKQPPKHKEIGYAGSLPCNRYKDQETQTSFREEPRKGQPLHGSQQPPHASQIKKSNTLTNGHFLKYGSPTTELAPSKIPTSYRKDRPIPPPRKTQFNKPGKPECPKMVVKPKTGQNESRTISTGLPVRKNEPSFAQKEETKSPCSIKEAFGQFLLKPVSRRPWDAISELESFNKELQKQEEKNEDSKENEQKQEIEEEKKMKKADEKAYKAEEISQDHGCSAEARNVKPATPVFKKGTNKSTPASENASKISDARAAFSDHKNVRSEAREMDKSVKEKKGNVGLNQRQNNARKVIKQAIGLPLMKSNVSGHSVSDNSKTFNSINSRGTSAENHKNKDSDKLKKASGRNTPPSEIATIAPLSFKRRNQGRSEPNLRSVGLDVNEGTSISGSSAKKIPSNESLHARASRILGIEVPVESLTANNKNLPDEDSDSDNMAQSNKLSNKKTPRAEMKTNVAASKGKPKSGCPKSTFIGEDISESMKNQRSDEEKLTHENKCSQQAPDLSKHQEGSAHSLGSAVPLLAERKSLPSNVEKKTKSTSKVTLTKQGKVASAVSRAAMDRIARMKEVDSVSRMRRLSIKNADSGEDRDEDKEAEGKGNDAAAARTEFPRKLSQGSCVSKRIISLNENERVGNRNTKKSGKDLPSSEVYDPSRVERV
ncbi:PREDICTED: junctional protein associated with coronary artery disease [Thamnophis sirtalis]|uniref:Junctional protein associated with coronary artery disease n=1 Tax=Thamnophis sirtalis TaxID=35019 RepID=A0A6I9X748_9SAUR|nr:PREDICTED: junctional protein associated with coronary artery disease [Thamnophis sirtalis]